MSKETEPAGQPGLLTPDARRSGNVEKAHPDTLSQKGAMALAKRLEDYWHGQGYPAARFWAVPVEERFSKVGTYELYRVVCNLVNGKPPQYRDDVVHTRVHGFPQR